ncbi:hypothetical protein [Clostridium frigidicarnis]|nr:hypothetical protein [Clostridium frigidicarnis]
MISFKYKKDNNKTVYGEMECLILLFVMTIILITFSLNGSFANITE